MMLPQSPRPLTFAENPLPPNNDSLDDDNYILLDDWDYIYLDDDGRYRKIHCKEGIIYDGASVPNILGLLGDLHPNGVLRPNALPHDLLFIFRGKNFPKGMQWVWTDGRWFPDDKEWTWTMSDKLFRRISYEYNRMKDWKKRWSYRILHAGSWIAWRSIDTKSRIQIRSLYE